MNIEGLSLLGSGRASIGKRRFHAFNPETGSPLEPELAEASEQDVDRAAELATQAVGAFARSTAGRRAELLQTIAAGMESEAEAIVTRARLETALPDARLRSELGRTVAQLRMFAGVAREGSWVDARVDHADPNRQPVPKPDVRSCLQPIGPVAVFGASNFPLAFSVAGGDTASALAAGNPVIVKAHPAHPGTSEHVGMVVQRAVADVELPEGVFSLLFDRGTAVGKYLVQHPQICAVGFTGSARAGRALMDLAAWRPQPIPVFAEMGSINPVFVLPGALTRNSEALAVGLHAAAMTGVGQYCTNPGLVVVQTGKAATAFAERLADLYRTTTPAPMLTEKIHASFLKGAEHFARTEGVSVLARVDGPPDTWQAGSVLFKTSASSFLRHRHLADEVFGPATLLVECADTAEMVAVAQSLPGQLTASVHGTDAELGTEEKLLSLIQSRVGRLIANGWPTGLEVCDAMVHGGPYPATSDGRSTSVGTRAISRFGRLACYQSFPDALLPEALKEANPSRLWRTVDGKPGRH